MLLRFSRIGGIAASYFQPANDQGIPFNAILNSQGGYVLNQSGGYVLYGSA